MQRIFTFAAWLQRLSENRVQFAKNKELLLGEKSVLYSPSIEYRGAQRQDAPRVFSMSCRVAESTKGRNG